MRKLIVLLTVSFFVGAASADLVVLRDLTDAVNVVPRTGVSVVGQDMTGTILQGTNNGYNTADANIYDNGGPTAGGNFLDITGDTIEVTLMYQDYNGPTELGFWIRMYAGIWDPDTETYGYNGWANASFNVPNDGQWHTFTKATADFEEPFPAGEEYKWAEIYKYRVDAVKWQDPATPFNFGLGSIPEPATLVLLALGALLRRR